MSDMDEEQATYIDENHSLNLAIQQEQNLVMLRCLTNW